MGACCLDSTAVQQLGDDRQPSNVATDYLLRDLMLWPWSSSLRASGKHNLCYLHESLMLLVSRNKQSVEHEVQLQSVRSTGDAAQAN